MKNSCRGGIRSVLRTLCHRGLISTLAAIGIIWCAPEKATLADMPRATSSGEITTTDWSSLGAMPAPVWDGKTLLFHNDQGALAVTTLSDDVVRVHFTKAKSFERDHSYAVIDRDFGETKAEVTMGSASTVLQTATLTVLVRHDPLRISFANAAGESLDADDPGHGIALAGDAFRVAKRLRDDEHVYGFGEKAGRLDKRGWKLGGYSLVIWNSDTYAHDSSTDPMYASVPFYLVTRHGEAYGIFLDNTWRSFFDVGHADRGLLTFGAAGGDLDYYFINGPDPKKVIERYTTLTGRMPLPPLRCHDLGCFGSNSGDRCRGTSRRSRFWSSSIRFGKWQQETVLFRVPSPGRITVALSALRDQAGRVWFDDVRLTRVPEPLEKQSVTIRSTRLGKRPIDLKQGGQFIELLMQLDTVDDRTASG